MPQYALDLNLPPIYTPENFFVSDGNREAWQWIESWPNWNALLLHGPSGSGKSHLGAIWADKAHATILPGAQLATQEPRGGNWLIEDIGQAEARALLHWFNTIREQKGNMLLTSRHAAKELPFTLPDLTSRLASIPSAHIDQPDDAVLRGAIRKQFADRQLKVDDEVLDYLLARMERSLTKARELVERIDKEALAEARSITIPFVKKILENF